VCAGGGGINSSTESTCTKGTRGNFLTEKDGKRKDRREDERYGVCTQNRDMTGDGETVVADIRGKKGQGGGSGAKLGRVILTREASGWWGSRYCKELGTLNGKGGFPKGGTARGVKKKIS